MTLTVYNTGNLGDAIQTLAMSTVVGPARGVFRGALPSVNWGAFEGQYVVNGWYDDPVQVPGPLAGKQSLFVGFHSTRPSAAEWCRSSPHPVGARDPLTHRLLVGNGVRSILTGCVTMLLPKYTGPRAGVISVDLPGGPGVSMTHVVKVGWPDAWLLARERLNLYRSLAEVHTSRLHVALPCLAMGTPVRLVPWNGPYHEARMGAWSWMGCRFGELVTLDTAEFTGPMLRLLEEGLGRRVVLGEPVMPVPS